MNIDKLRYAPRNVSTMLKVGFSESTMFKEARPLWGQQKFHKRNFCGGLDNEKRSFAPQRAKPGGSAVN